MSDQHPDPLTDGFLQARKAIYNAVNGNAISEDHGNSELFYLRDKLDEAAIDPAKIDKSVAYFNQKIAEFTPQVQL